MKINIEKIYIDGELPKSCASCQFLVHCDECEGHENYCPFIGSVGYDISDTLIDGTPVTPVTHRHRHCPVVKRPHGEWVEKPSYKEDKELGIEKQVVCSKCDEQNSHYVYGKDGQITGKMFVRSRFCPSCGADMRKEGDENG